MNSTIIAAIIGGVAAIIAAVIGLFRGFNRKKIARLTVSRRKYPSSTGNVATDSIDGTTLYRLLFGGQPRPTVRSLLDRARDLPPQQSAVLKKTAAVILLKEDNFAQARSLIVEAVNEAGISLPYRNELEAFASKGNLSLTQRRGIKLAIVSRLVLDGEMEEAKKAIEKGDI